MHSVWRVPARFSGENPASEAAGEPPDPPLIPPDPLIPLFPFHHTISLHFLMPKLFPNLPTTDL